MDKVNGFAALVTVYSHRLHWPITRCAVLPPWRSLANQRRAALSTHALVAPRAYSSPVEQVKGETEEGANARPTTPNFCQVIGHSWTNFEVMALFRSPRRPVVPARLVGVLLAGAAMPPLEPFFPGVMGGERVGICDSVFSSVPFSPRKYGSSETV